MKCRDKKRLPRKKTQQAKGDVSDSQLDWLRITSADRS